MSATQSPGSAPSLEAGGHRGHQREMAVSLWPKGTDYTWVTSPDNQVISYALCVFFISIKKYA